MARKIRPQATTLLLPEPDVQLVFIEKNLDIMGFFIADEFRSRSRKKEGLTERTVAYTMTRNSRPHDLRFTLKGTSSGLPTATDKDVWNAMQSLMYKQRQRDGSIANPVNFIATDIFREMGILRNGLAYKKVTDCLTRFKETTISTTDVFYNSLRKRYNERHFSIVTKWEKVGASDLDGSDRSEYYTVFFDESIIDNLNVGYVLMENIVAYRRLTRPAAKVIIGNIHYWFGSTDKPFASRDYRDLCSLLGITCYKHKSKIEEKLGPSLDELVSIDYLKKWEVQRSAIKPGFKICFWAGPELLRILQIVRDKHSKKMSPITLQIEQKDLTLSSAQNDAITLMIHNGIAPAKATMLAQTNSPESINAQIAYGLHEIEIDKRGKSRLVNPPGYLIYRISSDLPIPISFLNERKKQKEAQDESVKSKFRDSMEMVYYQWKDQQINAEIETRFKSKQELSLKIKDVLDTQLRPNKLFSRFSEEGLMSQAVSLLRRDVAAEMLLPSFDEWFEEHPQGELFS